MAPALQTSLRSIRFTQGIALTSILFLILSGGIIAGMKGVVHAVDKIFDDDFTEGMLLINASNA